MRLPTPDFLLTAFLQVCRRFPAAMLLTVLGCIACFALVDATGVDNEDFYARNWVVCQLGVPFLIALTSYSESKGWRLQRGLILQGIGLVLMVGCWFWFDTKAEHFDRVIVPQYMALLVTVHLAVAVAPYLNSRSVRDFWEYNRQIFANIVVGAAFTLILFIGLALAILAVENLFDLNIGFEEKVYAKLFILLAGMFNTTYFLYHFPQKYEREEAESGAYNWVFRNLCKYILIPIVLLYFVILYAYGAKVGLQWSLPKGWISSLVLGFSVAGIFTYLLNFYLAEEDESALVKAFKRWFWWVLLPLTVLLFIAIGKRIGDYGVTEERFLVAQLGVWLAAVCLYFLFSKHDNIKFIPISLGLVALVWAFGPLSAFSVSERSQKGILTEILARNGRFENGSMKPGNGPLTDPEIDQVNSTLYYLSRRDALSDLLPAEQDSLKDDYSRLLDWLNIQANAVGGVKTLNIQSEQVHEQFDIQGFDVAYRADLYTSNIQEKREEGLYLGLSENGRNIEWWDTEKGAHVLVESFYIGAALQKWSEKQDPNESSTYLNWPAESCTYTFYGKKGTLRWVFDHLQIEIDTAGTRLEGSNGWLLLKKKK